ncbi:alpha/beta hydrolase [Furfurilactobacillus siliginis]|uniref:Carboxylesterase n=1 Tax=Furfurilactobacillus siliginis TaxID=348151 RepID=A0A0R2LDG9_9LACO|nr:alpha/beta fold hydrolase [Furfurilactobacillus siliginis]KRN96647.1 esterase lipase [Furfurilactobacillus siliginis]GEK28786.1 carboxylesterase [Furfurilactobacillus siliginis]
MTVHFRQPEPLFIEAGPKAVLLLHAYAGSSNDMGMLARALARAGYTVSAPIFTGHGTLEPSDILTAGNVPQWLADAQTALAMLRTRGYHDIAVFGLSMGGLFATRLLELDPELLGGGTFASPVIRVGTTNVPQSFLALSQKVYARQNLDQAQIQNRLLWLQERQPKQLQEIQDFAHDEVAANLSLIHTPFFVGQGTADEMIDSGTGTAVAQRLTELEKHVTFKIYPGAGHVLTVNTAHKQLEQDVLAFLTTLFDK